MLLKIKWTIQRCKRRSCRSSSCTFWPSRWSNEEFLLKLLVEGLLAMERLHLSGPDYFFNCASLSLISSSRNDRICSRAHLLLLRIRKHCVYKKGYFVKHTLLMRTHKLWYTPLHSIHNTTPGFNDAQSGPTSCKTLGVVICSVHIERVPFLST